MRTISYLLAASILGLAACGGEPAPLNAGTSSGTLLVDARVRATPTLGIDNSGAAANFQTDITVNVWKVVPGSPNVPVTGAVVKVKIGNTQYTIPAGNQPQRYSYAVPGGFTTDMVYLDVDSGADFVHGVARKAPGIQVFTNPTSGQSVSIAGLAGAPFHVTWTRPAAADIAELQVSQYNQQVTDNGAVDVPAANFQTGDAQDCTLRRTNAVQIYSAAGSSLEVEIDQNEKINVVQ